MSGNCGTIVKRLQAAFLKAGSDQSLLGLVEALIAEMGEARVMHLHQDRLKYHRDQLRNWQIADSIIYRERARCIRARRAREDCRPTPLADLHQVYVEAAEAAGLKPMALSTFRVRSYSMGVSAASVD